MISKIFRPCCVQRSGKGKEIWNLASIWGWNHGCKISNFLFFHLLVNHKERWFSLLHLSVLFLLLVILLRFELFLSFFQKMPIDFSEWY